MASRQLATRTWRFFSPPFAPGVGYSRRCTSSPVGTLAAGASYQGCLGWTAANAGHATGEAFVVVEFVKARYSADTLSAQAVFRLQWRGKASAGRRGTNRSSGALYMWVGVADENEMCCRWLGGGVDVDCGVCDVLFLQTTRLVRRATARDFALRNNNHSGKGCQEGFELSSRQNIPPFVARLMSFPCAHATCLSTRKARVARTRSWTRRRREVLEEGGTRKTGASLSTGAVSRSPRSSRQCRASKACLESLAGQRAALTLV